MTEHTKMAESFINQRLMKIQANNGSKPLKNLGNALVLHMVPLHDYAKGKIIEIPTLKKHEHDIKILGPGALTFEENSSGVLNFYDHGNYISYTQVFNYGIIESVTDDFKKVSHPDIINAETIVKWLDEIFSSHLYFLQSIDASLPVLIRISFLGMKNVKLELPFPSSPSSFRPYAEEELHLPYSQVLKYQENNNYSKCLQKQMNILWDKFLLGKCEFFDKNGNLRIKRTDS